MRAIVLSVVLVASPALAQQAPQAPVTTTPATAPPPAASPVASAPIITQPRDPAPAQAAPIDSSQIPQAIDPMADLIARQNGQPQTTDEEEVEAAGKPAPRHRATILPIPPPEAPATPGGYLTTAQIYELRVKGSVAAAQNLQGPLDGGWRVTGADGAQLYALQIVDKAGGYTPLEGAWRDVRRPGTVGSTGLIDDLSRNGVDLVVRFSPRGGPSSILTLRPQGETRWAGELVEDGRTQTVAAEHLLPQAPAGYASQARGPYVWPPRVAAVSHSAQAAPSCSTHGKKGRALKAAKARCAAAARKAGRGGALKRGKGGHHAKAAAGHRGKAMAGKKGGAKKRRR